MGVRISGFELPEAIVAIMRDETWTSYTENDRLSPSILEQVFGEPPDSTWKFYDEGEIREITEEWHLEDDSQWFGVAPDDLVATQSVLIGELGYDRPFALDFRHEHPVVRFMTVEGRWVQIADSASSLLNALGIDAECS